MVSKRSLHNGIMPNVLLNDLPEDVHRTLVERAKAAGTSFQQYVSDELTRLARAPNLNEIVTRIEQHSNGTVGFEQALEDLDQIRRDR